MVNRRIYKVYSWVIHLNMGNMFGLKLVSIHNRGTVAREECIALQYSIPTYLTTINLFNSISRLGGRLVVARKCRIYIDNLLDWNDQILRFPEMHMSRLSCMALLLHCNINCIAGLTVSHKVQWFDGDNIWYYCIYEYILCSGTKANNINDHIKLMASLFQGIETYHYLR